MWKLTHIGVNLSASSSLEDAMSILDKGMFG